MDNIGKSIGHLIKGNYLRLRNAEGKSLVGAMLCMLDKNGHSMRKNLLQRFLIEVKEQPTISTKFEVPKDFSIRVQTALSRLVQQKCASEKRSIQWESSLSTLPMYLGPE